MTDEKFHPALPTDAAERAEQLATQKKRGHLTNGELELIDHAAAMLPSTTDAETVGEGLALAMNRHGEETHTAPQNPDARPTTKAHRHAPVIRVIGSRIDVLH